jgi:transposase
MARWRSWMDDRKIVQIKYRPRQPFRAFHLRKQRWSVLVCHRRAGKTVATLNDLIRGAVNRMDVQASAARYCRGLSGEVVKGE